MKDWTGCQINSRIRSRINEIEEMEGRVLFAPEDDDVMKVSFTFNNNLYHH